MKARCNTNEFHRLASIAANCLRFSMVQLEGVDSERDGLYFRGTNKGNTLIAEEYIPSDFFESFECPEGYYIGVPWAKVSKVLGRVNDSEVYIELLEERGKLRFESESGFEAKVSLVGENAVPSGDMPEVEYDISYECTTNDLKQVNGSCNMFNDTIHFEIRELDDEYQEAFGWTSGDTDDVEDRVRRLKGTSHEHAHTAFGTDLFKEVLKDFDKDQSITVKMRYNGGRGEGKNYPMRLETEMYGADIGVMIAPYQDT